MKLTALSLNIIINLLRFTWETYAQMTLIGVKENLSKEKKLDKDSQRLNSARKTLSRLKNAQLIGIIQS